MVFDKIKKEAVMLDKFKKKVEAAVEFIIEAIISMGD